MALRKILEYKTQSGVLIKINPFIRVDDVKNINLITANINQPDNGAVKIGTSFLSYDEVAELYGKVFPVASYDCDGNKIPGPGTLTEEERNKFNEHFNIK